MLASKTPAAARVAQIAAAQHGVVDLGDLAGEGIPQSTITLWARSGRLHRLHPGVFCVVPPTMLSQEGRWLAAVRACGRGAVLSHAPAGGLAWILPREVVSAVHVSVPDRRRIRLPGILVHRPLSLPPSDCSVRRSIPTTTQTRTVWDLAATEAPRIVRRAFEKADAAGRLDHARLHQLLLTCPNHRGARQIRELLSSRPLPLDEVRSWLEELVLHVCSEHGLPLPAVNVPLLGYEVDFLWGSERFVIEADGGDHLGVSQRDSDNDRDAVLGRAGFLVRRYSSRAMGREREVAEEVRAILIERAPAPPRRRSIHRSGR